MITAGNSVAGEALGGEGASAPDRREPVMEAV
jgi:hypothetical protein